MLKARNGPPENPRPSVEEAAKVLLFAASWGPGRFWKVALTLTSIFGMVYVARPWYLGPPTVVLLAALQRPRREDEDAGWIADERVQHFRQLSHQLAVVQDLASRAEPAADDESVLEPGIDRDIDAVEFLAHLPVVVRVRHEVTRGPGERRRRQIEGRQRLSAAIGQPRVGWRREREPLVVCRPGREIVGDTDVAVRPSRVLDLGAQTRDDLVLNAGRELPVVGPLAPALHQVRIVGRTGRDGAEQGGVDQGSTLTVGGEVVQVAVMVLVAVEVGPRAGRLIEQSVDGMRRVGHLGGSEAGGSEPLEILVERDLQRRAAVAEQVVGRAQLRRDVVPVRGCRIGSNCTFRLRPKNVPAMAVSGKLFLKLS